MRQVLSILFFCSIFSVSSFGQTDSSKADVFGGYSYVNIDTNGISPRQSANGWEASASGNFNRLFAVEFDVNGYYKTYNIDLNTLNLGNVAVKVRDYSYVAGPRINLKPVFIHALVGGDHLSGNATGYSASQDGLAGAFGGGIQQKVSGPWSVRLSADYVFTRHNIFGGPSVTQNNYRVGAGIVYSFGTEREKRQPLTKVGAARSQAANALTLISLGVAVRRGETSGAEVMDVSVQSAAARAHLAEGDVINSVDGKRVSSPAELAAELSNKPAGTKVEIGYLRGYWQLSASVILGQ
jgi:hypothetical protein